MPIPKVIQQQVDDSAKLHKELYEKTEEPALEEEPVEEEVVEEELEREDVPIEGEETPPVVEDLQPEEETWEQRYKVLQGKYDAEVPALHTENRNLSTRIDALEKVIREQPAKPAIPSEPEKVTPEPTIKLDVESYREKYGDDIVGVAQDVNRLLAQMQTIIGAKDTEIADLKTEIGNVGKTQAKTSADRFDEQLYEAYPNYDTEINKDQNWFSFLNEADPISGYQRRVFAQEAIDEGNAPRLIKIIDLFKGNDSPSSPVGKRSLDKQVVPRKEIGPKVPSETPQKPTYTRTAWAAELERITQQQKTGKIPKDEFDRLSRELHAAMNEGRVTA